MIDLICRHRYTDTIEHITHSTARISGGTHANEGVDGATGRANGAEGGAVVARARHKHYALLHQLRRLAHRTSVNRAHPQHNTT